MLETVYIYILKLGYHYLRNCRSQRLRIRRTSAPGTRHAVYKVTRDSILLFFFFCLVGGPTLVHKREIISDLICYTDKYIYIYIYIYIIT